MRTLLPEGLAAEAARGFRKRSRTRPCSLSTPTISLQLGRCPDLWSRQAVISSAIAAGHSSGTLWHNTAVFELQNVSLRHLATVAC